MLTDGDVRRWLTAGGAFELDTPAIRIANRQFVALREDADPAEIEARFSDKISFVPLTDPHDHLRAVAWRGTVDLAIGKRSIGRDAPAYVIAEIGNNHNGSLDLAKRLIDLAAESGADCAKFQMRDMASLYGARRDGDDDAEDLGSQYVLDLLKRFQLQRAEFTELFDHCRARNILPLCTPWDLASVEFLDRYGIAGFKVASAKVHRGKPWSMLSDHLAVSAELQRA